MIRKNLLNFKLNFSFFTSKSRFLSFMERFDPEKETCPSCGAKGRCRVYASYKRYIVDLSDGKVVCERILIKRVICTCGHTHAILPDFIVPYIQYSLPFILYILRIWFSHAMTAKKIEENYGVCYKVLRRWTGLYGGHKDLWLGRVRSGQVSPVNFLDDLLVRDPFSGFTRGFYMKTLYSFLQSHANPANCRHLPVGWTDP